MSFRAHACLSYDYKRVIPSRVHLLRNCQGGDNRRACRGYRSTSRLSHMVAKNKASPLSVTHAGQVYYTSSQILASVSASFGFCVTCKFKIGLLLIILLSLSHEESWMSDGTFFSPSPGCWWTTVEREATWRNSCIVDVHLCGIFCLLWSLAFSVWPSAGKKVDVGNSPASI